MNPNDESNDSLKKDKLEEQLESSFQSSFRSTYSNLKRYERGMDSTAQVGHLIHQIAQQQQDARDVQRQQQQNAADFTEPPPVVDPPVARHAPHHSWLLGSYGGKKKPPAVRTKTTLPGVFGAKLTVDGGNRSPATQKAPALPPGDFQTPSKAQEMAQEMLGESAELYAPTVEVSFPVVQKDPYLKRGPEAKERPPKREPIPTNIGDEVKHLYAPTLEFTDPPKPPQLGGAPRAIPQPGPSPGTVPIVPPKQSPPPFQPEPPKDKSAKQADSASGTGDGGKKKHRLPSYIDRQVGSYDDEQPQDTTSPGVPVKKAKKSNKGVIFAAAVVIGIAGVGAVVWQGINNGGGSGSSEWIQLSERADSAIERGLYAEAIGFLNSAIKINSGQATLYHKRGLAKLKLGSREDCDAALEDLNTALNKNPNLVDALMDRAAVRIELGQFDQAVEDYDKLLKAGKDTNKVHYGRGLAKYYTGNYDDAEAEFRKILDNDSSNVEAAIALGTTLYKGKHDKEGAEVQYNTAALALKDQSGLAYRNMGIMAFEQGDSGYNEARKDYNDAIAANPGDAKLFNERGILSWAQKDPLAAASDFKKAVERAPRLASAQDNLNFVCKSLIDEGRAKISEQPKSHVGYALVAFGLSKLGRYKDALYYANEALQRNQKNIGCFELVGTCCKELGMYDEALSPLSIAISVNPNSADAYSERAWVYFKTDKNADALKDAITAIQLDGTLPTPYIVRSSLEVSRGNFDKVLEDINHLVQMEPTKAARYRNASLNGAMLDILQKKFSGAADALDKLIAAGDWQDASTYNAVLFKWVALNHEGKDVLAREVLLDCKKHAGSYPWPMPVVRYLLGDLDFEQMQDQAKDDAAITDAHFYAGMKSYFEHKNEDAQRHFDWVVSKGVVLSPEYLLARKAREDLDSGPKAEGGSK